MEPFGHTKALDTAEAHESTWHAPAGLATTAAIIIAVLCVPGVSDRLSPLFAQRQMVANLSGAVGDERGHDVYLDFGRELCPYGR
jgi:hypothetical protein